MGTTDFTPAYLALLEGGELAGRVEQAFHRMEDCDLCGRYCRVNRRISLKGVVCRTGELAVVDGFGPHHGEEPPLRGRYGSGTIFFSWCNLRCIYCQNWEISHKGRGREVEPRVIADMMLALQAQNCHNINLVSPSHVVAQVLAAVNLAAEQGLRLPIVYNSGGFDSPEALQLLDGVIDIYMPDMKYGDSAVARKYSAIKKYVAINQAAVREMHRQVGDLVLDDDGIAQQGLLVRHLVLPQGLAGTDQVLDFLAREISPDTYLNLMDQYYPSYKADHYPELTRRISSDEFREAVKSARRLGLNRLD
jgi:putative pyruvate formate lyase activating enzyme